MHNNSTSAVLVRHLGLIPDGARRWAIANQVTFDNAYIGTMKLVARYVDIFYSYGVSSLSIYLASSDNIEKREHGEVASFVNAEHTLVSNILPPIVMKWSCSVAIVGISSSVTKAFRTAVEKLPKSKEVGAHRFLYLLIDYDPMAELHYAKQSSGGKPLTLSHFWVPEYVDGIIRTGGEQRLSNFLPLQSGYAEFYFLSKLFLDTNDQDMSEAYHDLTNRYRRQGK